MKILNTIYKKQNWQITRQDKETKSRKHVQANEIGKTLLSRRFSDLGKGHTLRRNKTTDIVGRFMG